MEFTQKQELYINRYMKSVADALTGRLTEKQSDRAISRLQTRIIEQLKARDKAYLEDTDVLDVLRKMGAPENQADILVRVWGSGEAAATSDETPQAVTPSAVPKVSEPTTRTSFSKAPARKMQSPSVWLGVIAWLAAQWDLPVWAIRILAVLLGAVTLPVALLVYMSAYFWLRLSGQFATVSPLHPWRMFFRPVMTALMLGVIHFTGIYAIKGVYIVHDTWLKRAMPDMSEWAWFETEAGRMFFWAFFLLLPLALFSAMPLANAWDYSLKRLNQACVALYAIVVSFGVASFVTGIILAFVREFTGR